MGNAQAGTPAGGSGNALHELPPEMQRASEQLHERLCREQAGRTLVATVWNDSPDHLEVTGATASYGEWAQKPPEIIPAMGIGCFASQPQKLLFRLSAVMGELHFSPQSYTSENARRKSLYTMRWELLPGGGGFGIRIVSESPEEHKADVILQTGHSDSHFRVIVRVHVEQATLSKDLEEKLLGKTHFTSQELKQMHQLFMQNVAPLSYMTEGCFSQLFPQLSDPVVVRSIFRAFDSSVTADNKISFQEFAQVISIMAHGTIREKAEMAYDMCDLNKDGTVEKDEVQQIALQLSTVMMQLGYSADTYGVAEQTVQNVFSKFTVARDFEPGKTVTTNDYARQGAATYKNSLTKDEFVERALNQDADFLTCFGLFDYFRKAVVEPVEQQTSSLVHSCSDVSGWMVKGNTSLLRSMTFTTTASKRFFMLRGPFLAYAKDETMRNIINVVSVENAHVKPAAARQALLVSARNWTRTMCLQSEEERNLWIASLRRNAEVVRRFKSFAPQRTCNARWFVCGKEYFDALLPLLRRATNRIFICDWCLSPELYLKRDTPLLLDNRLDQILIEKARQGVKIYVMIWGAPPVGGFDLQSAQVVQYLRDAHQNIFALSHPFILPVMWSHHQKLVVLDDQVAFVGGIDLCYGRYEEPFKYPIVDPDAASFPGHDYTNCNIVGESNGPCTQEVLNRKNKPRLPWHDIHVQLEGSVAEDVVANFIQRWNFAISAYGGGKSASLPERYQFLLPLGEDDPRAPLLNDTERGFRHVACQMLRSICSWSGGVPATEQSIYKAYMSLIKNSEHFIYIENQYFISSIEGTEPENHVVQALFNRLKQAIVNAEDYVCVVVLPVYPAGDIKAMSTRYVTKKVMETICQGGKSLLEKLRPIAEQHCVSVEKYIQFYALRNHGVLPAVGSAGPTAITEQVYVHTKALIVDDRKLIIGSANINDRSMCGNRDSEIAVVLEEAPESQVDSLMAGRPYRVSPFVHSLRVRLWRELAGLAEGQTLDDPIMSAPLLLSVAQSNSDQYCQIFGALPDNALTIAQLPTPQPQAQVSMQRYAELASCIRGFITVFPYKFLQNENVQFSVGSAEYLVPKSVFL
eukprot:TRINITY_DN7694_c0_g1_i1.p1 TRINITY_DN7694_c0_g1~~TRINITY_DN7694_c0_g1_i1.p1  ORF type:complete len:1090 (-),score=267.05 TRINITY_DN7694_c0_g1_i1:1301-4570(-)